MLASITHFLPLTLIRRERLLPIPGRVFVHTGEKVAATDPVAEMRPATQHLLLDIARGLGLDPDEAEKYLVRQVGDALAQGDIIAGPVGLFQRAMRAPGPGRIVTIGEGQVLLELDGQPQALKAGIPGTIAQVIEDRGVIIETTGALVQGVWGNGQIDKSLISILAQAPSGELSVGQLDVSQRGAVVVSGYCPSEAVLQAAINLPLHGLILASMPARLISLATQAPFPIILLEGFGQIPMNSVAFKILIQNAGREISVNASLGDAGDGSRPEAVIPLPADEKIPAPRESDVFTPGQTVRILRLPWASQIGTLVSIRPGQPAHPSGVHAPSGAVRLESGEQLLVPLADLDVIE